MFVRIFVEFDNVNIKHSVHRHIKLAIQHLLKTNKTFFCFVIYGFLQWRQMKRVCDQKRIKRRERRKRAVRQSTAADGFTAVTDYGHPMKALIKKKSEILGRYGRQNMLRPFLKIWDWDLIFGRAVKAISSLGVRSPCSRVPLEKNHLC